MTTKEIRDHIEGLVDLTRGHTLKELNAIKHIGINNEKNSVILLIEIGRKGGEAENILKRELAKVIKLDLGYTGIKIQFEESREASVIAGKNTKFIVIASNKGGVGKSTVAINLAYALQRQNKKVGIIDGDVYTSSIPLMLYMEDMSPNVDVMNKIIPFNKDGIQIMSTYFFSEQNEPLLWKSAMAQNMLNNFLYQVSWDKALDYIIIDCPTSTGDIWMQLTEALPKMKALIVSETDMLSSVSNLKMIKAAKQANIDILGIILNKIESDYGKLYFNSVCDVEIICELKKEKEENTYLYKDGNENFEAFNDLANLVILNE